MQQLKNAVSGKQNMKNDWNEKQIVENVAGRRIKQRLFCDFEGSELLSGSS